ncbi:hydantoinase B/oxoprolinase family protein [Chloroflexota bacterium]
MTNNGKELDPILVAVLDVRLMSICEEMGRAMMRTSRSPVFAEVRDFATAIFDKDLRLVAQKDYIPILAGALPVSIENMVPSYEGDINEGDIFIHNDCYTGNNHLPDVNVIKPVFYKGELVFWCAVKGHQIDIGGRGIIGYDPTAKTIWDEGLRIPTCKLFERGKRNRAVWDLILSNVKVPKIVEGDLACETGAVILGERSILSLLDKYGRVQLYNIIDAILSATEKEVRNKLGQIPDGVYLAQKSTDYDGIIKDKSVAVRTKVIKHGNEITIDLSDSDPQTPGYINSTYANTVSACYLALHAILGVGGEVKRNEGAQMPVKIIAPEGLVVNPSFPAPVVASTLVTAELIVETIWMALSDAIPRWVQAAHGRVCRMGVIGFNPRTGRPFVNQDFFAAGGVGSGGTEGYDGWDEGGPLSTMGQLRKPDVEIIELSVPIRVLKYEQEPDRSGVGRWRGGNGTHYKAEYLASCQGVMVGQGLKVFACPAGLLGGKSPPCAEVYLHRNMGQIEELEVHTFHDIKEGDICEQHIMGGAGFGDPLERDTEKVQQDVRDSYVSVEAAARDYGVVIDTEIFRVDVTATEKLRSKLKRVR